MTVKCSKCQHKNPDGTFYCGKCGAKLQAHEDISLTHTKTLKVLTPSKTIAGKYKIQDELGRGGMGVVYKAKDMRLDRTVALKFLPPELTRDEEARKRFIQEAKAAAALEHPNICTVYEVDEADGHTFIAMSYIEGQSLKDKLKDGPLSIDEAREIDLQVAEGLREAHEKGIIHRDIKPANIMLTDKGQAKITDFGLAKLSWGIDLTKPATIMGTVAYMSPEQAKGEKVDHRTDIWSLGAMLYEMLTGERPFMKAEEHALIYSILNDEPRPISEIREDIPGYIADAISKTLEKDKAKRFENIHELIHALKQSPLVSFQEAECSIVVLPFDDLSPGRDNEYFSDGLTEEIITDLSQVQELCVISRNSAMALKGTKKNTKTIGKELNVQYVLEGSVRKAGNDLRITAQLIDARSDRHLWANKYAGTLDDVFAIQEKVSRSIVDALRLKLSPEADKKISEKPIDNVKAYEFYMRARQELFKYTDDSLQRALQYLKNGLNIIGENILFYSGIGYVYYQYFDTGLRTDQDYGAKAEEYANKIFKLDPNSSHAHRLIALVKLKRENAFEAYKHLKQAYISDPNDWDTLFWLAPVLTVYLGKSSAARPLVKKALEIDPLTPISQAFPAFMNWMEGRFDLALEYFDKWRQMEPDSVLAKWYFVQLLLWNHRADEANKFIDEFAREAPGHFMTPMILFLKFAFQKKKKEAYAAFNEDAKKDAWNDFHLPWYVAECYALLDERDEAMKWLEHAVDRTFINYPLFAELDPFLENIRGEPRFKKLMERVKHEWENFEV